MKNPWIDVPLVSYEGHMGQADIAQMQGLRELMRRRFVCYPARSIAVWGVAGGNGLSHIQPDMVDTVLAVDINEAYLAACAKRNPQLSGKLQTICADLTQPLTNMPHADLLLADLLVEYIGIPCFIKRVAEAAPLRVCCVIQCNNTAAFVSASPYMQDLSGIGALHTDIESGDLVAALARAGYRLYYQEEHFLRSGKSFLRLDFVK